MLRYQLTHPVTRENIQLSLNTNNPNDLQNITFSGSPYFLKSMVRELEDGWYGAFGHIFSLFTTPIDLDFLMHSSPMQEYNPVCLEGTDTVRSYNPNIPPDCLT